MFEEVLSAAVFVLQPASLRPRICPSPTMNALLLMRPWTVFGRYRLLVYSALYQCCCCVCASVCVMRVEHTDATLCFMLESARKQQGLLISPALAFQQGSPPAAPLQSLSLCEVRGFLVLELHFLSCQLLHFKTRLIPRPKSHTHLTLTDTFHRSTAIGCYSRELINT